MSTSLPTAAIRCQLRGIVRFALSNDQARLHIRCALRDALAAVERDQEKGRVIALYSQTDEQLLESLDNRTSGDDAYGADGSEHLEYSK